MIQFIYPPEWFYDKDVLIDVISVIVLFLIGFFSFAYYRINKNKRYILLAISFLLLAISFIFKIITQFLIYQLLEAHEHELILTYQSLTSLQTFFFLGILAYRFFQLFGIYVLYSLYTEQNKQTIAFMSLLLLLLLYFTDPTYYIFHFISCVFLFFVTFTSFGRYRRNKHTTALLLSFSFLAIAVSHVLFMFHIVNDLFYVAAELTQLFGYLLLLITLFKVLRYGKKTQ